MTSTLESSATTTSTRRCGPGVAALRPLWESSIFLVVVGAMFLAFDSSEQFVLSTAVVYALVTASLGILLGWSGVYTFGHAAFFGIGAYTAGVLKDHDWSPLVFVLAGAVVAALVALLVGTLGARIVAVEFAMMTLIVGQVAYLLTFKVDALEGDNGIYGIPAGSVFGVDLMSGNNMFWYLLGVTTLVLAVLRRIQFSPYGAALNAVRDDPIKAAAIGLPVRTLRLSAFVLAGATAGAAGVLFAQLQGIVTPATLSFHLSGQLIIMLLFGGLYRFWGAPIGAVAFVLLNDRIFGETSNGTLILGLILLFIVVVLPGGILGIGGRITDQMKRWRR